MNDLIGTCWTVLDKGFIKLLDVMGSDESICSAARISYGKGTRSVSDDRNLIRYLMRHSHTSPFEMAEIQLHVKCPIYVFRQWVRHRTANINEYSGRYSEMIDDCEITDKWRLQSDTNKQGSKKENILNGEYFSNAENIFLAEAKRVYKERLKYGIAREQARKDMPLSNYTEVIWKCDLHNILHFLKLRMDSHAQLEIRSYANIIGHEIVAVLWPQTWEAFQDYVLDSVTLSGPEVEMINFLNQPINTVPNPISKLSKREVDEFKSKMLRLGVKVSEGDGV